jgi:hypothetical protein
VQRRELEGALSLSGPALTKALAHAAETGRLFVASTKTVEDGLSRSMAGAWSSRAAFDAARQSARAEAQAASNS